MRHCTRAKFRLLFTESLVGFVQDKIGKGARNLSLKPTK